LKSFFDTSVLVATVLAQHPHHVASLAMYRRSEQRTSACAAHSLAELYATLTRLPGKQRMGTDQVLLFLDDVRERLAIIHLTEEDYYSTISSAAGEGVLGGTIYDALLARCALKSNCEIIYTWNIGDFRRLGLEVAKRTRTP
jgi:predicted nucleic acid-binding protein